MGTNLTTRSNRLRRTAAAFGIMLLSGFSGLVGAAALATEAGALPNCPWWNPNCTVAPTTPTTRPPVFDPPGGGVLDPNAGDPVTPPTTQPPATPPTTKPPTNTGGNNGGNNGGQRATTGGGTAVDTPADVPLDATPAAATTKPDDGGSDSTGLILALVAGIALLGAAGTGLYLKYGRNHV